MSGEISYDDTLKMLREVLKKGLNPFHLEIACALREEIAMAKNVFLGRSIKARRKLKDDTEGIFRLAIDTYLMAFGATTEREAVRGVMSAYLRCGMDLEKARVVTKTEEFVLGRKEEEA